ncbi:MAG: phenylalanine--tRNA ligase subunit alpha [Verrucomicrobiae bacterium]|nr:phenylalanine--tRNA ligase subunit alpha [Verrucomicrobiae bacterium]
MLQEIDNLQQTASETIQKAKTSADLENARLTYLSKKGALPQLLEKLKTVPADQKPLIGKKLNEVKTQLETLFANRKEEMESQTNLGEQDLTLPGRPYPMGKLHPLTQITDQVIAIFRRMGFALAEGPDIETEFNNFDALNTPADHPARNEKDTFYINQPPHPKEGRYLLRTQTSPVQIRVMQNQKPPLRIICPGRCYRRDEIDATHSTSFHQIEGLVVNENISLADLKGTLEFFFKELLGPETRMRLRPHFFPFTEPSFEVDLNHPTLNPKGKKWLEIAGCGMVDPNVFQSVGYDSERYTGFAFGMGIERIAMILQGVPDLRLYEQNDLRFLNQF